MGGEDYVLGRNGLGEGKVGDSKRGGGMERDWWSDERKFGVDGRL